MLSVAEALEKIVAGVDLLPQEQVSIADAHGRVLAEDLQARVSHPPQAVSAMDGYAGRWTDLSTGGTSVTMIGESAAGHPFDGAIEDGQVVRIFTGAHVPLGADTILIQEDADRDGDIVTVRETPAREGEYVRPAGMDFAEGNQLLTAGRILTARDVGLAAAMNHAWLMVRRRPRVAYLATGDEVVQPGQTLAPGQIVSSNSLAFPGYIAAMGGDAVSLGIARDDRDSLIEALRGARGTDILVTMGGASVGDHDLVQQALGEDGFDLGFYRIAMRPGKPLIFGHVGGTPFMGLPGNPVSTGVTSAVFLRAALIKMQGISGLKTRAAAVLGSDAPENGKREDYIRASLEVSNAGQLVATPFSRQDSAMLGAFARAECLIVRPPFAAEAPAGTPVEILPLDFGGLPF